MDGLRSSMSLRVYAQKDPLVEYKNEAFDVFKKMMDKVYLSVVSNLFRVTVSSLEEFEKLLALQQQEMNINKAEVSSELLEVLEGRRQSMENIQDAEEVPLVSTYRRTEEKIGRNDPCPCGSGKKYKKCCGR